MIGSGIMNTMFWLCVMSVLVGVSVSNKVYPPTKVIELSLAVSKATYLPLGSRRFIKNGAIIENPSSLMPRRPFPLIYLPPKYDPAQDKAACSITGWKAKVRYVQYRTDIECVECRK